MPIYMDRHDVSGVTAKDVAEVHQLDLKIQDKFKCKGLTYWFDEERGTAFCLVEAPNKGAVKKMHDQAHGLIPNQIIEVQNHVVEAFLGRITDPKTSEFEPVIAESAFRTIMFTELKSPVSMRSGLKDNEITQFLSRYENLIHKSLAQYHGRETRDWAGGFIASFTSASNSVKCAVEILKSFKMLNSETSDFKMEIAIGISTGAPVTDRDDFFGDTIQLAKRLSYVANEGRVVVSCSTRDFYKEINVVAEENQEFMKAPNPVEEKFLNQLMDIMEAFWNEEGFNVENLGKQIGLSKSQLYRKITSLTGYSPNNFIQEFRLRNAVKLIEKQQGNISEIAFESGFSNPSYFTKCFQKRFGILPSGYANKID